MARALALMSILVLAAATVGCERPGCENAVLCVEQCFTPVFRQCDGCPSFSFPVELCDRQTVCVRDVGRPAGTCDAPCTEGESGRCLRTATGDACSYDECQADADCPMGTLCACSAGPLRAHVCVPASCTGPEDCGDFPCSSVPGCGGTGDSTSGGATAIACRNADDECFVDAHCPVGEHCTLRTDAPAAAGTWRCSPPYCE